MEKEEETRSLLSRKCYCVTHDQDNNDDGDCKGKAAISFSCCNRNRNANGTEGEGEEGRDKMRRVTRRGSRNKKCSNSSF